MAHSAKRQELLTADSRRFPQKQIYSPQRRRVRREIPFCLSGDDDKQKHICIGDKRFVNTFKRATNPDPTLIGGRNHLPLASDQKERAVRAVNEELTVSEI